MDVPHLECDAALWCNPARWKPERCVRAAAQLHAPGVGTIHGCPHRRPQARGAGHRLPRLFPRESSASAARRRLPARRRLVAADIARAAALGSRRQTLCCTCVAARPRPALPPEGAARSCGDYRKPARRHGRAFLEAAHVFHDKLLGDQLRHGDAAAAGGGGRRVWRANAENLLLRHLQTRVERDTRANVGGCNICALRPASDGHGEPRDRARRLIICRLAPLDKPRADRAACAAATSHIHTDANPHAPVPGEERIREASGRCGARAYALVVGRNSPKVRHRMHRLGLVRVGTRRRFSSRPCCPSTRCRRATRGAGCSCAASGRATTEDFACMDNRAMPAEHPQLGVERGSFVRPEHGANAHTCSQR